MSGAVRVRAEPDAIVVGVPLKLRKRGNDGRKLMVATGNKPARPVAHHKNGTVLKAFGRAYRWKRMFESGEFASISDLANAEKINHAYVRRILRLTLLSPAIIEATLNGGSPKGCQLEHVLKTISDVWPQQELPLK
jgi:hypothetical protein